MRKISLFISIILVLSTTGCSKYIRGNIEINNLEFIELIAIDKKDDLVKLSVTEALLKGEKGTEKKANIVCSEGKTVFEAIRKYQQFFDKRPFFGHTDFILIGEEAAKEGILNYIDFLSRDHEIRLNLNVFVVKGGTAEELLRKGTKENLFVHDRLAYLIKNIGGNSMSVKVDMVETMYILDIKYLSLYLPTIELVKQSKEAEEMDIKLSGYAIFNKDKLAFYLNDYQSRGLNWLMNNVESGIVQVKSPEGTDISLEIIDSNTSKKAKVKDGTLIVDINVEMSSNVGEITGPENIFKKSILDELNRQQEEIIKEEIVSVLSLAQEKQMDFFSTGLVVWHDHPIKWQDNFSQNWSEAFSEVNFNVNVKGRINRTYDIREPNAAVGG